MDCRPHPIPFAKAGDYIIARGHPSGTVERVAEGHGWPCYLVRSIARRFPFWVGHEDVKEVRHDT